MRILNSIIHAHVQIHSMQGPPSSPLNLMQHLIVSACLQVTNRALVEIQWDSNDMADHYTVIVSPPIESGSTFTTSNTSIQLPVLYNQEYNISVVANNCAGNSLSAEISIRPRVGKP